MQKIAHDRVILRTGKCIPVKLGSCMYLGEPINWLDFRVTRSKVTGLIMYAKKTCSNIISFLSFLVGVWYGLATARYSSTTPVPDSLCGRDLKTCWVGPMWIGMCWRNHRKTRTRRKVSVIKIMIIFRFYIALNTMSLKRFTDILSPHSVLWKSVTFIFCRNVNWRKWEAGYGRRGEEERWENNWNVKDEDINGKEGIKRMSGTSREGRTCRNVL